MSDIQREAMEYDVVIVGAGPAGLSAAIRIKQLSPETTVCVLEKGSEVGAHILSGAVIDPIALNELIPDWKEKGAPLNTPVKEDRFYVLGQAGALRMPNAAMPPLMSNHGAYAVSLGNVCRWLAQQAEGLGVEIYPGFAASEVLYREDGSVRGVVAGVMGIAKEGGPYAHAIYMQRDDQLLSSQDIVERSDVPAAVLARLESLREAEQATMNRFDGQLDRLERMLARQAQPPPGAG